VNEIFENAGYCVGDADSDSHSSWVMRFVTAFFILKTGG